MVRSRIIADMATPVKLCFGLNLSTSELADGMGAIVGPVCVDECSFCKKKFADSVNYCSNCGADLRCEIKSLTIKDIVELALLKFGEPPRSISISHHEEGLVIGHVLGEGVGMAVAQKDLKTYLWKSLGSEIKNYVERLGIEPQEPTLFAIVQKVE